MDGLINLYGVACGRCGHAGYTHDANRGLTWHVDRGLRPCQTKPPTPTPAEETKPCPDPQFVRCSCRRW